MKYLEFEELDCVQSMIARINSGDRRIFGRLEAYSCKSVGSDKRLLKQLETRHQEEQQRMQKMAEAATNVEIALSPPLASGLPTSGAGNSLASSFSSPPLGPVLTTPAVIPSSFGSLRSPMPPPLISPPGTTQVLHQPLVGSSMNGHHHQQQQQQQHHNPQPSLLVSPSTSYNNTHHGNAPATHVSFSSSSFTGTGATIMAGSNVGSLNASFNANTTSAAIIAAGTSSSRPTTAGAHSWGAVGAGMAGDRRRSTSSISGSLGAFAQTQQGADSQSALLVPLDPAASRKTLFYLIGTLNAVFQDYDFSHLRSTQFSRVTSMDFVMRGTTTTLCDAITDPELRAEVRKRLWTSIDAAVTLQDCDVFTYHPDLDSDPFGDGDSLWTYNYFFFNRKLKRVVFFACRAVSYRAPRQEEESDEDLFDYDDDMVDSSSRQSLADDSYVVGHMEID